MEDSLSLLARRIGDMARRRKMRLAVAESCTGGLIAKTLTDEAGASEWFSLAVVAYDNAAKRRLLRVSAESLRKYGAVSETVAEQMCRGVLSGGDCNCALSVTGIAGPGGGGDKPVGTVCFGWRIENGAPLATTAIRRFDGDRTLVRRLAADFALRRLGEMLADGPPAAGRN